MRKWQLPAAVCSKKLNSGRISLNRRPAPSDVNEKKRINKNLAVCERQTIVEHRCPTHKTRCYHKQGFQKVISAPGRRATSILGSVRVANSAMLKHRSVSTVNRPVCRFLSATVARLINCLPLLMPWHAFAIAVLSRCYRYHL